jgi:hypothetical protein
MNNGIKLYKAIEGGLLERGLKLRAASISLKGACYAIASDRSKPIKSRFVFIKADSSGLIESIESELRSNDAVRSFKSATGHTCSRWIDGISYDKNLNAYEG